MNLDKLSELVETIKSEREAKIAELSVKAAEVGLKPLVGIDFIWVPLADDTQQGGLPEVFFTHNEESEGEPFIRHALSFPIRNLGELATAVAEADVLYSQDASGLLYDRYGISGLVDFLRGKSGGSAQEE